jgi:hypothetical protein
MRLCWDDPTFATNCATIASIGKSETSYGIAPIGAFNPNDGIQHTMYAKILSISNPEVGDVTCNSSPWPWRYVTTMLQRYPAKVPPFMVRGVTPTTLAVIANSNDPYSIGSTGSTICTVNNTPLKDDGAAGYYIQKYAIPCTNAYVVTVAVQYDISQTNFASQILPAVQAMPASIQGIALAWVEPVLVDGSSVIGQTDCQPNSVQDMVANGGVFHYRKLSYELSKCDGGDETDVNGTLFINPLFNSNAVYPYTVVGWRPTMYLVGETCTSGCVGGVINGHYSADFTKFKTMVDNAFAARNTNPVAGNVDWAVTSDTARRILARSVTTTAVGGNALSRRVNGKILGSIAKPASSDFIDTNILLYVAAASTTNSPAWGSSTVINGAAMLFDVTSTAGCLPDGYSGGVECNGGQTPLGYYLGLGAVGTAGQCTEPSAITSAVDRFPDPAIFVPNYARGATMIESLWKSVKMTDCAVFAGDPLASPFTPGVLIIL